MEYIEHCCNTDVMMIYELCAQYIEITMWSQPDQTDVRQNTVYGIGAMSKHMNQAAFKSMVPKSLEAVEHVLSDPEAMSEQNLVVTENAYCTLGKLCLLHT
jgi:hypothetical protein